MKIPVLMYHRIGDQQGEKRFTVSRKRFERQMAMLARRGYRVISLTDVIAAVHGVASFDRNVVAITFDDGFHDSFQNACPALASFGFGATFFIVSGLVGKTSSWMEREGFPSAPLMSWTDVRSLIQAGFHVGSHTRTHCSLKGLNEKSLHSEIIGSKLEMEDRLGAPIDFFAYPYGQYDTRARELVERAGFVGACSTRSGFNNGETDPLELSRIDVSGMDSDATFLRSLTFGENSMTAKRVLKYYAGRAAARLGINIQVDGH